MKKYLFASILILLMTAYRAWSCPVCDSNQPEGLENVTHGTGPTGIVDFIITWTAVIIVGITLFLSVKYLVKPKEHRRDHIKNIVINEFNR